jgi:hypothetical protein
MVDMYVLCVRYYRYVCVMCLNVHADIIDMYVGTMCLNVHV